MTPRLGRFALGVLALMILAGIASNAEQFRGSETRSPGARSVLPIEQELGTTGQEETRTVDDGEPPTLPEPVVIALAIALGIGGLYLLSRQRFSLRFRRPSVNFTKSAVAVTEEQEADAIATMADDLIEALREGDSPRQAIQRAYAAVETGFGAPELARKAAETPLRYMDRIFGRHRPMQEPLAQLTALFQRARFSPEPVDESMRDGAIASLTEIRDYYQAFAWKKIEGRRSKAAQAARAAQKAS